MRNFTQSLFAAVIMMLFGAMTASAADIVSWTVNVTQNGETETIDLTGGVVADAGYCSELVVNSMTIVTSEAVNSVQGKGTVYKQGKTPSESSYMTFPFTPSADKKTWTLNFGTMGNLLNGLEDGVSYVFECWPIVDGVDNAHLKLTFTKGEEPASLRKIYVKFVCNYEGDDISTDVEYDNIEASGFAEKDLNNGREIDDFSMRFFIVKTTDTGINDVAFKYNIHKKDETAGAFSTINAFVSDHSNTWMNNSTDVVEGFLSGLSAGTEYYFEFYVEANNGELTLNNGGGNYKIAFKTKGSASIDGISEDAGSIDAPKYSVSGKKFIQ